MLQKIVRLTHRVLISKPEFSLLSIIKYFMQKREKEKERNAKKERKKGKERKIIFFLKHVPFHLLTLMCQAFLKGFS
jgi:hypothetical protein